MNDVWFQRDSNIPQIDNKPFFSACFTGPVGSGKTQFAKECIKQWFSLNYGIVILDVEDEYDSWEKTDIKLPSSLITGDIISSILQTDAQYIEFVVQYFRKGYDDVNKFKKDEDINSVQFGYLKRAVERISYLVNKGSDLIETLNKEGIVRIVPDYDFGAIQMIVLINQLIRLHKQINSSFRGVIVFFEENEAIQRIDKNNEIPKGLFHGRKRQIYFVVVSHQTKTELEKSSWGSTASKQISYFKEFKKVV